MICGCCTRATCVSCNSSRRGAAPDFSKPHSLEEYFVQVGLDWLADFVEVPALDVLVTRLGQIGIEVESVRDPSAQVRGVVVAVVESCEPHPEADRLKVCRVFDGKERQQVVCGAANVA